MVNINLLDTCSIKLHGIRTLSSDPTSLHYGKWTSNKNLIIFYIFKSYSDLKLLSLQDMHFIPKQEI